MKVAVITPYFNAREDWLTQCHESVMRQTHPCTHIMVADGRPQAIVDRLKVQHIKLPVNVRDYGDTPRGIGSVLAIGQGFDAIAYLDDDNWYYPEHIETMVQVHLQSNAAVITAFRNLHRLDGSLLGPCPEVDGVKFVDANCYFFTREAFTVVPVWWMMKPYHHAIDDRVILAHIRHKNLSHVHSTVPTVAYRTAFKVHYKNFGEEPPPGTKDSDEILRSIEKVKVDQGEFCLLPGVDS
ncbi:MAG: hypothetical protein BMS9Abin09_0941 [Gammaproteobacteria bacterium]|nr:MAG: hypothetical protein BMS9Abin09_0941 [Gammaproteobacteria bacterium]